MAPIKTSTCDTPSPTINGYVWGRSAVAVATRLHLNCPVFAVHLSILSKSSFT